MQQEEALTHADLDLSHPPSGKARLVSTVLDAVITKITEYCKWLHAFDGRSRRHGALTRQARHVIPALQDIKDTIATRMNGEPEDSRLQAVSRDYSDQNIRMFARELLGLASREKSAFRKDREAALLAQHSLQTCEPPFDLSYGR